VQAFDVCKIKMRCQSKSKVSSLFPMNIASIINILLKSQLTPCESTKTTI
jgi:hypothetical protein